MSVQNAQPLISEARMLTRSSRLSSTPLSLIIWPSSKSLRVNCGDCFVELSLWLMGFPPFAQMTFGNDWTGQAFAAPGRRPLAFLHVSAVLEPAGIRAFHFAPP